MDKIKVFPHDLLRVPSNQLILPEEVPDWVGSILQKNEVFVVVRRGTQEDQKVPIGIRGDKRSLRYGAYIEKETIKEILTPYDLSTPKCLENISQERFQLPSLRAMKNLLPAFPNKKWGPTGSVAFELATGIPTAKETSDLDLIFEQKEFMSKEEAIQIYDLVKTQIAHIDIQVITPFGGFALEEYVQQRSGSILLKTETGPILTKNPWKKSPSVNEFC